MINRQFTKVYVHENGNVLRVFLSKLFLEMVDLHWCMEMCYSEIQNCANFFLKTVFIVLKDFEMTISDLLLKHIFVFHNDKCNKPLLNGINH